MRSPNLTGSPWARSTVVLLGILAGDAGTSNADGPTCPAMPAPVDHKKPIELDVNGDRVPDRLIPVSCDDDRCALAVVLRGGACPVALGTIGDTQDTAPSLRHPRWTRTLAPLTSHGIALVRIEETKPFADQSSVWAWSGERWVHIFDELLLREVIDGELEDTRHIGMLDAAASACLDAGAPAQTLDIDGDGTPDAVYRVPCPADDRAHSECGRWITLARGACRVPIAVVADGIVSVVHAATPGEPVILRVTGGAVRCGRLEYRFAATKTGLQLDATRSCATKGHCDDWITPLPVLP